LKNVLQLVLFDLDDTLFDHQYSRRCGLLALQHTYPLLACLPIDDLVAEHERQLTASYDQVLDGAVSLSANRLERFRRMFVNCGVAMPVADVERAMQRYRRAYEAHRRAVPGVMALLAHLQPRLRVGVVTNGLVAAQREKIVACQLEGFIDFLLTSEEAQVKKPDPRFFLLALEQAHTRREDAVVVGDSWTFDVLGAHQAGIRSIWLNRWHEPCPEASLTTELQAFEPLEHALQALYAERCTA
jgi:HAD superfamily hydrolase (TIGR01549 family)